MNFKVTPKTVTTEAIIPEGYEIQMTLQSLTPETKNLMFDSINNPVRSHEESKPKQDTRDHSFNPYGEEPDWENPDWTFSDPGYGAANYP